jgi:hypothetical protein
MSALGQKQTFAVQKGMSALPPKADMCSAKWDVRKVPIADIRASLVLSTNLVGKGEQRGRHYSAIIRPALRPAWLCRCLAD